MAKRRANGEGSLYKRSDGTWTAQYTDCNGKKRYLYGKTQQIVKDKLKEAIRRNETGQPLETLKVTFANWLLEWLEVYVKPTVRPSTYHNSFVVINTHIIPAFPKTLLKDLRENILQKFLNEKLISRLDGKPGGYSTAVCQHFKEVLYRSLEKAVELGYIPRNPAAKLVLPVKRNREKQIYTQEQQQIFVDRIRSEMRHNYNYSVFLLLLYTGMRAGEALGLQVGDIDFESKEIHIRRTVGDIHDRDNGGRCFYIREPKTLSSKRTIPLAPLVEELLRGQIERRNWLVERLTERWAGRGQSLEYVNAGFLYLSIQGQVLYQGNLNKQLNKLTNAAEIPHISLHGLRHTFATRWIEAGLDVKSLAEILGHSDVKMTLNVYTHAVPAHKRKNMEAMGQLFAKG